MSQYSGPLVLATAPGTSYVHEWKSGDVVMWGNRATMHRGRPWLLTHFGIPKSEKV